MKIGIDKIGFYTPHLYLDMNELAIARNEDPAKYTIGIGQLEMAVNPITQDSVTLAANAALEILEDEDMEKIDLVIFATETGIDHSKSGAIYVHQLLNLNPYARAIEMKEACYAATCAVQLAKGYIAMNPDRKVLVLGSDISRYGLNTPGEVTQGAGAVALLLSANPRILTLEDKSAYYTKDIMDFWRPVYSDVAFVKSKYSNEQYISFFQKVWRQYQEKTGYSLEDMEAICFHMPYTKMGIKALRTIIDETTPEARDRIFNHYEASKTYNKRVGNIYTGSLYLSLLSLLENGSIEPGSRIGMFSYGSGAVGEFFSGILEPGFREVLLPEKHHELLDSRQKVSVEEYEEIFSQTLPEDGTSVTLPVEDDPAPICLAGIKEHERQYVHKNR